MTKILTLDIERTPIKAYVWGRYDQNISQAQVIEESYVLCWAAKWLHSKKIMQDSQLNYGVWSAGDPTDDKKVITTVWHLLDEADIVVGHNVNRFDLRVLNASFLRHGLNPPSPYKVVDTLTVARRVGAFSSNRLGEVCSYLGIGDKLDTGGFDLWPLCMSGDRKAWYLMHKYNKQDVALTERLYLKLRAWAPSHPSVVTDPKQYSCQTCGSHDIQMRGVRNTNKATYQRFVCNSCGRWGKVDTNIRPKEAKAFSTSNI